MGVDETERRRLERLFGIELERTVSCDGEPVTVRCYRDGLTMVVLKNRGFTVAGWPPRLNAYAVRTLTDAELTQEIQRVLKRVAAPVS